MKRKSRQYEAISKINNIKNAYMKACDLFKFMFYTSSLVFSFIVLCAIITSVLTNAITKDLVVLCIVLFTLVYCNSKM